MQLATLTHRRRFPAVLLRQQSVAQGEGHAILSLIRSVIRSMIHSLAERCPLY
jgi:hypothetical protein